MAQPTINTKPQGHLSMSKADSMAVCHLQMNNVCTVFVCVREIRSQISNYVCERILFHWVIRAT